MQVQLPGPRLQSDCAVRAFCDKPGYIGAIDRNPGSIAAPTSMGCESLAAKGCHCDLGHNCEPKYLYPRVVSVRDKHVALAVHYNPGRFLQLPVAATLVSKFGQEAPVGAK